MAVGVSMELRTWHLLLAAALAVAGLGLASGKLFFSTTTTREVVRTVTVEAIADEFAEGSPEEIAQANVRASIPAAEAYFADHNTYVGLNREELAFYDSSAARGVVVVEATATSYCIESSEGAATASKRGPAAEIVPEPCSG
jgi:hypothetical protein